MGVSEPAALPIAPRMLRSWTEICAYTRLSRRQLERYRKNEGLPIMRWGRHVVLVPDTLGQWLVVREKDQRARRAARREMTL